MLPDVSQSRRSQQGVSSSVGNDVGIGMSGEALMVWDHNPTQNEGTALDKLVEIVSNAGAKFHGSAKIKFLPR